MPRASIVKEDSIGASPSPDLEAIGGQGRRGTTAGQDPESTLLVGDTTTEQRRQDTICSKLRNVIKRLFSTHQFRNLQVNTKK